MEQSGKKKPKHTKARFLKGNKRVYAGQGILTSQNACKSSYRLLFVCTPYLQHTTPTSNSKHMKTKDLIFQPTASYLGVQTATGSSDSPAAHVFLLLGLPRHTPLGPSVPEELTQVFPVLVSPSLVELERSMENTQVWTFIQHCSQDKKNNFNFFSFFFFSLFKEGGKNNLIPILKWRN